MSQPAPEEVSLLRSNQVDETFDEDNVSDTSSFRHSNDIEQGQSNAYASDAISTPLTQPQSPVILLLKSALGFNKAPFSLLFVIAYAAIVLVSYLVQTQEPSIDISGYPLKFISDAWIDLQQISRDFHSYSSHANDRVHDYILQQISDITIGSDKDYIEYDDDVRRVLFQDKDVFTPSIIGRVNYYESNNVLAKVVGSDPSLDAVLLSAHYDSVPTAYGTTDDGAGIASMLSILRYYADESTPQPLRSIVFNFNNNEEFGLLGAESFFYHPWSNNVSVFLNLEGTGAGGRAILFRASDYGVAKHFKAASTPHANSIFQQGFSDGIVRSETDYKVYTKKGLRGLDVAFYKPRNLYHTRRDSIRGSSKAALSHMFTNALDVTQSLANAKRGDFDAVPDDKKPAVFFDIFGTHLIVFPLSLLFKFNVIGIVGGALIVSLLFFTVLKTKSWNIGLRGWLRGVISLALSTVVTFTVAYWVQDYNELIVVSSFLAPFFLLLSVFLLTNYLVLSISFYLKPVSDQKLVVFLESAVLLWSLLIVSTVHIAKRKATGEFLITIVYYLYTFAIILGLLGILAVKSEDSVDDEHTINSHTSTTSKLKHVARRSLSFDWSIQFFLVIPIGFYIVYNSGLLIFEALHHNALEGASGASTVYTVVTFASIASGFLVLPFIHRFHALVGVILLIMLVVTSVLSFVPFPLSHQAPMKIRFLQSIDLDKASSNGKGPHSEVSVLARTGYGYQVLSDLPSVKTRSLPITCKPYGHDDSEVCSYEGPRPWVISDKSKDAAADYSTWLNVTVLNKGETANKHKRSLTQKRVQKVIGKQINYDDDDDDNFGPFKGEIFIEAKENRVCTISFNTTTFSSNDGTASPVRIVTVYHDDPINRGNSSNEYFLGSPHVQTDEPDVLKWYKGINDVTIHKLNWTQPGYHLEFQWIPRWYEAGHREMSLESLPNKRSLGLQITCQWAEYDGGSIVAGELKRKVPALDEVLEYGPPWVSWTNWGRGLVEVKKYVELTP